MTKMAEVVSAETMDGSNLLEKSLNAYLTTTFILSKDVPTDECLSEARAVIEMVEDKKTADDINEYLMRQFGLGYVPMCWGSEIIYLLNELKGK